MKNNIHNYIAKTAIDYANIAPEEVIDPSGEVLGFFSEPVEQHETDGIELSLHEHFGICA